MAELKIVPEKRLIVSRLDNTDRVDIPKVELIDGGNYPLSRIVLRFEDGDAIFARTEDVHVESNEVNGLADVGVELTTELAEDLVEKLQFAIATVKKSLPKKRRKR